MITKIRIATFLATIVVGGLLGQSCRLIYDLNKSDKLEAIGGVETYRAQRVANLLALKGKISIPAPDVRQQEIDSIDRQISDIENEVTEEMGAEARRIK